MICKSIPELIGNTPLLELQRYGRAADAGGPYGKTGRSP